MYNGPLRPDLPGFEWYKALICYFNEPATWEHKPIKANDQLGRTGTQFVNVQGLKENF